MFIRNGFFTKEELDKQSVELISYPRDKIDLKNTDNYIFEYKWLFDFHAYKTLDELMAVHFSEIL